MSSYASYIGHQKFREFDVCGLRVECTNSTGFKSGQCDREADAQATRPSHPIAICERITGMIC